jgi:hypothetical protein
MLKTHKAKLIPDSSPRLYLFFISVVLKLLASALSGAAFVTWRGPLFAAGTAVWVLWLALLFIISLPDADIRLAAHSRRLKRDAVTILALLTLVGLLELAGMVAIGLSQAKPEDTNSTIGQLLGALHQSFAYNDGTALCHQAAQNLREGQNPYASANIVSATLMFGNSYDKTTPIRTGRFADEFPYPGMDKLKALWDEAIQTPDIIPPEIESRLNYPAACFVLPMPFLYAGITDLRLVYLVLAAAAVGYVVYKAPPPARFWLLGAFLVSLEISNGIASGETGALYFPFLLLAWVLVRRKLWLSALCMGLAIAVKQVPWLFMPFYIILILRTAGLKPAAGAAGIAAAVFAAFNLPFVIMDAGLWLNSVLAPLSGNFFPLGVGIVSLVSGGYLHIESPLLFSLLSLAAGAGGAVWYWFNCRRYPHAALVLAMLPLFCAWRSLWPYFYYVDVILISAVMLDDHGQNVPGFRLKPASRV